MYLTKTTNNIRKASEKLEVMYLNEKEKEYYEAQQKRYIDETSRIQEAVDEAVEKAELSSKIEIAKNAIKKGFDNQTIVELTNLPTTQIEKLRKEMKK